MGVSCQKFIRFTEKVDVSQHIFGARREAGKQKAKRHAENLKLLQLQLEEQNALEKAVVQHHEDVFARSQGKESARGATLPIDQSAERAHILETLLTLGIPLSKLGNPQFQALIEKPHQALGGRRGVLDLQPVVYQRVQARLKAIVAAKPVSIISFFRLWSLYFDILRTQFWLACMSDWTFLKLLLCSIRTGSVAKS